MTSHRIERASGDKGAFVRAMFARIAPRYDTANRVLTAGLDERWRRRAIAVLGTHANDRILDLCCGTGDLVFNLVRHDSTLAITGADFCAPMLERARERAAAAHVRADFVEADAMALPFDDGAFDGATMGFSLRNVEDVNRVLAEVLRVLRPGGKFVNLDISKAPNPLMKRAFDAYFYGIVPIVGGIVGGSRQAYTYLPNSLTHHPNAQQLRDRFAAAGFADAGYVPLVGGTIAIHYGTKP
ncbi:MAG TPA: bifunctional demethylmenaquinone methyltransferase/2-methoxy-6-polyprenyl-1,4-benzoquinol methylase UbiE [Candidatus Tumulicola sp.]|jgi:demethylmenaquinone methyltransferase/2-methoxy-6-polyprenyl-1,4-benzoquinol methylase